MIIDIGMYKERGYTNKCRHNSTIDNNDFKNNNHFFLLYKK